eukprot:sb/3476853/
MGKCGCGYIMIFTLERFECLSLLQNFTPRCYLSSEYSPFLVDQTADGQVIKVTKHVTEKNSVVLQYNHRYRAAAAYLYSIQNEPSSSFEKSNSFFFALDILDHSGSLKRNIWI